MFKVLAGLNVSRASRTSLITRGFGSRSKCFCGTARSSGNVATKSCPDRAHVRVRQVVVRDIRSSTGGDLGVDSARQSLVQVEHGGGEERPRPQRRGLKADR